MKRFTACVKVADISLVTFYLHEKEVKQIAGRERLTKTIQFVHAGRQLEIRAKDVGHTVQIWIEEYGKPLHLYSALSRQQVEEAIVSGRDIMGAVMQTAQLDVQEGKVILPSQ